MVTITIAIITTLTTNFGTGISRTEMPQFISIQDQGHGCRSESVKERMATIRKQIEGTKVAKVISIECLE
jgi:hypothetical protein